jgi:hypothetical protein
MIFLFPTKPYYLLGKRAENLNRQKELNVVSTNVLQPERYHGLHDIPISNKTLILTREENLNRQKELNVVSTKVLQPERSHWLHDIPISNKALLLTVSKSRKY